MSSLGTQIPPEALRALGLLDQSSATSRQAPGNLRPGALSNPLLADELLQEFLHVQGLESRQLQMRRAMERVAQEQQGSQSRDALAFDRMLEALSGGNEHQPPLPPQVISQISPGAFQSVTPRDANQASARSSQGSLLREVLGSMSQSTAPQQEGRGSFSQLSQVSEVFGPFCQEAVARQAQAAASASSTTSTLALAAAAAASSSSGPSGPATKDDEEMERFKAAIAAVNNKRRIAQHQQQQQQAPPPSGRSLGLWDPIPARDAKTTQGAAQDVPPSFFGDPALYHELKGAYDFAVQQSDGWRNLLRAPSDLERSSGQGSFGNDPPMAATSLSPGDLYKGCLEVDKSTGSGLRLPLPTATSTQLPMVEEQSYFGAGVTQEDHWQDWSHTGADPHSWAGHGGDRWSSYDAYGRYRHWEAESYGYKDGYAYRSGGGGEGCPYRDSGVGAGGWGNRAPSGSASTTTASTNTWNVSGVAGYKPQCQFFIGIEEEPKFRVTRKILGQHGSNVKRIAQATNSKLRLRGRGSGFLEGKDNVESTDALMLCISAPDESSYQDTIQHVTMLLEDVYEQYKLFCRRSGKPLPELAIQMHEGPRPGSR